MLSPTGDARHRRRLEAITRLRDTERFGRRARGRCSRQSRALLPRGCRELKNVIVRWPSSRFPRALLSRHSGQIADYGATDVNLELTAKLSSCLV